jgi:hypothetical protein
MNGSWELHTHILRVSVKLPGISGKIQGFWGWKTLNFLRWTSSRRLFNSSSQAGKENSNHELKVFTNETLEISSNF